MTPAKRILLILIAVIFSGIFLFDLNSYFTLANMQQLQVELSATINQHFWMIFAGFFAVYVVVAALSIPGAVVMTLLAGSLFGLGWGLVLVSFASTIGATLAFWVARFMAREGLEKRYAEKLHKINEGMVKEGPLYLFTLRLIPVFPFFLINLVMGLTQIPSRTFYWVSQLGMLPGTFVFVNAGTQLAQLDSTAGILSPALLGSFVLLGIFPFMAKFILQKYKQKRVYHAFKQPKQFDRNLIVIGAGSGGLVTAYIAAAVKAKVTLIEKHRMGGDCLNTGCVPSKALIRSSKLAYEVSQASELGYESASAKPDFAAVMARIANVVKTVEPHDSVERYSQLGVECLQGEAKIISPWEVEFNGQRLTTRNIVVATGARPLVPRIPGLDDVDYLTSDNVWSLTQQPQRLLVLGGGPIGCELAQSFSRLGSQVTQVEMAPHLLGREDADVSELIEAQMRHEGVDLKLGYKAVQFNREGDRQWVTLEYGDKTIDVEFDKVMLALGRVANTKGFGLEELGVEIAPQGTIAVNDYLQTNYPNIFAVGDVAGPYQFTHFAAHQAWYASVNALFGAMKKFKADYRVIPAATYTAPEVARVGLNETEAKAKSLAFEVTKFEFAELDRSIADGHRQGFVKVLTPPGKDKILGATIVGEHAGELLAEFTLAMRHNLGLNKILGTIHAYPTLMEGNKYVAGEWKRKHVPHKLLKWVARYHHWQLKG
jgi:pyruvate/2-oxoglutarate dehydrogenase complex dihydrolipoamide dehydrogenase (E3) component/uncharacterized membrane protein YdjX (TVP38/TMEM64 family)